MTTKAPALIPVDAIAKRILFIRGQRVITDSDLAKLYGVATKVMNQAVKEETHKVSPYTRTRFEVS